MYIVYKQCRDVFKILTVTTTLEIAKQYAIRKLEKELDDELQRQNCEIDIKITDISEASDVKYASCEYCLTYLEKDTHKIMNKNVSIYSVVEMPHIISDIEDVSNK